MPAFRDAFHFYYPQAVWLDQCALQGEYFPQWQCNEALGVDVAGETTSALYYPLRIVWFLPVLSVAQRYAAFVFVHLLITALGTQYACSRLHLRKEAGWLAGASFALSCPVLFQHNNLVFLSSAAWLGFAIAELFCWLFRSDADSPKPRMLVLGGAITLMVLAGDPHTAVNVCILAVFLAAAKAISIRSASWFGRSMVWLAGVVVLAVGLSAVQSIQSLHWANQSHRWSSRSETVEDRSIDKEQTLAPKKYVPSQLVKIMNEPTQKSASAIYQFSLSPWHLSTVFWPTLGGKYSPENSRTFSLIPAEGRMWIPSLFFGFVPVLLLLGGFKKYPNPKYSLLLLAVIFALLASFGNYSVGWLLRSVFDAFGASSLSSRLPPDHHSSLYGLLAEWLPGYSVFRYPAKWSVIAVACACFASASRFNEIFAEDFLTSTWMQRVVLVTSGLGLVLTLTCGSFLLMFFKGLQPRVVADAWLGSTSDSAMFQQIWIAFSIPIAVLGLMALVQWRANNLKGNSKPMQLPVHALLAWICLLETFSVATGWCSFVPSQSTKPAEVGTSPLVWSDASEANIERDQWLGNTTDKPSVAIAEYQRAFVLGKLGLLSNHPNLASMLSIEPRRMKQLRIGLARIDNLSTTQPELDSVLAWLGVERRLVRTTEAGKPASLDWQLVRNPKQLCELVFDDNSDGQDANVTWQWIACGRLQIKIDSPAQCHLLVRQFNDDGWHVLSDRDASPKLARDSSRLFIECAIESGKSTITLQRLQWPRQLGITISVATLLLAMGIGYFQLRIASATKSRSK